MDFNGLKKTPEAALPAHMQAMATLPVFYKLDNRKVVLVGGGEAGAWKAELLASTGANVHIYACNISAEMEALIKRGSQGTGSLSLHRRPWSLDIFQAASLAVGDIESDAEAHAFYCAAKSAGVPVNVIDNPKFCEFQFGGIVNRSPVVVSISTDGAAPILGQSIRRRIETLIPPRIADWGKLAKSIRHCVNETLPLGALRRQFWEKFSDLAFSRSPNANEIDDLQSLIKNVAKYAEKEGHVTLVGAGPGDPELLTLGAVRALQAADVILFDDLASNDVLDLARREAQHMLVGKRGGRESCRQEDINAMMVQFAKQGKHVVRLKSGDPTIFGRAGEEISRLQREGIPFTIVPGITCASAMAARLNVSLTHRDHAQSVRFVTGHSRKGKLPENVDWKGIADPHSTTIFYMGGRTASEISERLIIEGLSPTTPVVIMSSISRDNETRWFGSLEKLGDGIKIIGYENPVLIGVGAALGEAPQVPQIETRPDAVTKIHLS